MRFQISTPDDGKSAVDQQTRQVWGDKVRRDGEAQRYMGREGAHELAFERNPHRRRFASA